MGAVLKGSEEWFLSLPFPPVINASDYFSQNFMDGRSAIWLEFSGGVRRNYSGRLPMAAVPVE